MIRIQLPIHRHPLYPAPWISRCSMCCRGGGYKKDGYSCYECFISLHKECAESSLEINHPYHHEHPLHLSFLENNWPETYSCKCKLCGQSLFKMFYYCSICDVAVDTACAKNPPPDVIEHPKAHQHPLVLLKNEYGGACDFCDETTYDGRYLYKCFQCQLYFHFECSKFSLEINFMFHPKHPVKLLTRKDHHFSDGECRICGKNLDERFYHCLICKFSVDISCVMNPPPLSILFSKAHEHQLNLMPRKISFDCDVCGMNGDRSPYSCQQCDFMIHQKCIDLPEIININRHEHRLSSRFHLTPGNWTCGVCQKEVDWSYGAYSCLICSNYAVHSRCVLGYNVWDRLELKGIPEETQELEPFKTINGNLICHFSHEEHYLKLNEENIVCSGSIRCAACIYPIYSQAFYRCVQCDFVLHKTCANLPRKKRHVFSANPLTLICSVMRQFFCQGCHNYSSGFRYQYPQLDAKCGALSDSIIHESHPCRLYYSDYEYQTCVACGGGSHSTFRCDDCKYVLDFKCVVLPKTTEHWYDEHLLSLCYDGNTSGEYWCDLCERKQGTKTWFYTCKDCCVTFHIECVLGEFSLLMPGRIIHFLGLSYEVMPTSPGFLPRCYTCRSRRPVPFVLKVFYPKKYIFICSFKCYFGTPSKDLY